MLTFYLSTVVIWMIILLSIIFIFKKQIKKNGWIAEEKKKCFIEGIVALFAISAVPILRFVSAIICIMMVSTTKEKFYEWIETNKK